VGVRTLCAAAAVALTGCASVHLHARPQPVIVTKTPSPGPTITILRSNHVLAAGLTADFTAQAGVRLRLTASRPSVSRQRLSSSYGYAPAHGYYVTFRLTLTNTGSEPVDISPRNFSVKISGEGTVGPYDGNAPYSGASQQLDTTELEPGDTVRAPLTFDVRRVHGVLQFVPDRSAAVSWTF
jgi:hypothetical protein